MMDTFSDWLGRTVTRHDHLTHRHAAEWTAMLGSHRFDDDALPGLHWMLAPAILGTDDLGPDGAERKGLFLPPIPLPRRMWAGGEIETFLPLTIGADITRRSTLSEIRWRDGRNGRICVVAVMHEISMGTALCLRERQDLLFREPTRAAAAIPAARRPADLLWPVDLSPTLLFRFSALTFNGHRIHYDHPYAVSEEGYAGLVTHGPLQATLLLNQAACVLGHVPRRFIYRCLAPLIAGKACDVATARSGADATGWISDHAGVITCEAQAID